MRLYLSTMAQSCGKKTLRFTGALLLLANISACSFYDDRSAKTTSDNSDPVTLNTVTPNFIVVLTDDQGWTSLSSSMDKTKPQAKSDYHQTPHIDSLLEEGMRFSNGYAAAPVCSPTRYSILFGKSPARLQRTKVDRINRVDHDQTGIPQVLKSINPEYRAAHFGKWHIGANPSRYGYDVPMVRQRIKRLALLTITRMCNGAAMRKMIQSAFTRLPLAPFSLCANR